MVTYLLDANVVIALTVAEHTHHEPANEWFDTHVASAAVSPSIQGSLARFLMRVGESGATAHHVLDALLADERIAFWPDSLSYADIPLASLTGHRQVTDAYLAALARSHEARLATFDAGLVDAHPDVATLIG